MYGPVRTVLWADGGHWSPLTRLQSHDVDSMAKLDMRAEILPDYLRQLTTESPFARLNSRTLSVTSVRPKDNA